MQQIDPQLVNSVVSEVMQRLGQAAAPVGGARASSATRPFGVFEDVNQAVAAAKAAQQQLKVAPLRVRKQAVECLRNVMRRDKQELGHLEFEETKIGRLEHKIDKLDLAASVPGVEFLENVAQIDSGDRGVTVTEFAPFGVFGVVTPVTHSVPTLGCNAIMIVAAGNALVCNPHPSGARCIVEATRRWNREIHELTGIDNLVCVIAQPTLDTAQQIFTHPDVNALLATGGPGVAKAAMSSGKRAIAAGPGNPPVVVDETADIDKAAAAIILGAAYDNNLLCIGEKEVFVVESVAEELLQAMARHGAYRLTPAQMNDITPKLLHRDEQSGHWLPNKEYLGQDPQVLASAIGLQLPAGTELLYGQTDLNSPLLPCEQMMPIVPIVAVRDFEEALRQAIHFEHGFKHTAIMWSRDVDRLTRMGRACEASIFVANGPCVAGLAVGGQGYPSFSTATPTGDGVTSPLTFTRARRAAIVDQLRFQ
jgi:aldehyde dehydrogenase